MFLQRRSPPCIALRALALYGRRLLQRLSLEQSQLELDRQALALPIGGDTLSGPG